MNIALILLALQTIREYKAQAAGDLSKALGYPVGYVALVEEGRKKISLEYLIRFANYARMDVADIFNMATALENGAKVQGVTNTHMEEKINHMVDWVTRRKEMEESESDDEDEDEEDTPAPVEDIQLYGEVEVSEPKDDCPEPEKLPSTRMFSAG